MANMVAVYGGAFTSMFSYIFTSGKYDNNANIRRLIVSLGFLSASLSLARSHTCVKSHTTPSFVDFAVAGLRTYVVGIQDSTIGARALV